MNPKTIDFNKLVGKQVEVLRELILEHNKKMGYESKIKKLFKDEKEVELVSKQPNGITIVSYVNDQAQNEEQKRIYSAVINDTERLDRFYFSYNPMLTYALAHIGGTPDFAEAIQKLCNLNT